MSIEIKMPALSPTMEEGTLAKWLVKEGDTVQSGDLLAEIETDKATMEFEAVDEGVIGQIVVPAGTEGVKVGTVIAVMAGEGGTTAPAPVAKAAPEPSPAPAPAPVAPVAAPVPAPAPVPTPAIAPVASGNRVKASPIARRLAKARNIDLATLTGTGPNGRIVKVDVEAAAGVAPAPAVAIATSAPAAAAAPAPAPIAAQDFGIPHEAIKLSNMRKTIARRLTESKQTVPHIYLTVDVRLDALLKLRTELNASLASRGVKLSVNDLLIKVPSGLIDIKGANDKSVSSSLASGPGGYVAAIRAAQLGPEDRDRRARESGRHLPQLGLHPHQGAAALGRGLSPSP
jgi:pyruvate dehydrogenase E2 component (dihydrolipoamide acetyltransferase)